MANEYLRRTPTSTGNRKVFTWSGWIKRNKIDTLQFIFIRQYVFSGSAKAAEIYFSEDNSIYIREYSNNAFNINLHTTKKYRDVSSWYHILVSIDTTSSIASDRAKLYVNGDRITEFSTETYPSINIDTQLNDTIAHQFSNSSGSLDLFAELTDIFFVDGQALTPDVFGFYKDGDGYISVGSTQATDFRPGQWMPHAPSKIKKDINRRGEFGVNGFYLPMNDSSNPGADFHCAPNSIIKLKGEDLPQPRNGAPTTSDAFVSQVRKEIGGLGFAGCVRFDGTGDSLQTTAASCWSASGNCTFECFIYPTSFSVQQGIFHTGNTGDFSLLTSGKLRVHPVGSNYKDTKVAIPLNAWSHIALVQSSSNQRKVFINGVEQTFTSSGSPDSSGWNNPDGGAYIGDDGVYRNFFNGFMSNVRVIKGTALYTANFTAPTEPLTNVTNTKLLCCNSSTSATASTVTPGTITANGNVFATTSELTGSIVLAVPGISTATGANLVTNGTFDTNTTSWTLASANGTLVASGGELEIQRVSTNGTHCYQQITTESGKRYTVSFDARSTDAAQPAKFQAGTSINGNELMSRIDTNSTTMTHQTASFTATGTTTYITLGSNYTANSFWNNIVVKQEDAPTDYSADIKGSGTNKTPTLSGNSGVGYELGGYYGSAYTSSSQNDYLEFPGTSGDFNVGTGDFTIEMWLNPDSTQPTNARIFGQTANAAGKWDVYISSTAISNQIRMMGGGEDLTGGSGSGNGNLVGGQWDHFCLERYSGQLTTYMNGVAVYTQSYTSSIGDSTYPFRVGQIGSTVYGGTGYGFTGDIQDFRFYKGLAKYKGGFDVPKPYTPVGIEPFKTTADTCKNNFCTMNPLIGATKRSGGTIVSTIVNHTDGNLTTRNAANAGYAPAMQSHSNFGMTTGKWYWECSNFSTVANEVFGISKGNEQGSPTGNGTGIESVISFNGSNGTIYIGAQSDSAGSISPATATIVNSAGAAMSSTSDVVGFAFDADNSSMTVYLNGVLNNTATNIVSTARSVDKPWRVTKLANGSANPSGMSWNFGQNPTFSGTTTAGTNADTSGKGLFKYAPPTGFLALCEDNLPTPAIADPGKHFKTVLWSGDGNSGRGITGLGFQPDLVWIKERTSTSAHAIFDSVRGAGRRLVSNLTNAEQSGFESVYNPSFNNNGFTVGSDGAVNQNGQTYVAWCWKAGGAAVSNSDGTITSQVSANQTAGFSIVKVDSLPASTTSTFGHGLNKKPDFIIFKSRNNATNWDVYHSSLTPDGERKVYLNSTSAEIDSGFMGDTPPTSSVISFNPGSSISNHIVYCWTEIEGYSKFGSYVGNASADGTFIYCGFKPAFVITKRTDSTSSWLIHDSSRDPVNPVMGNLYAHSSDQEGRGSVRVDFISNGFKHRNADGGAANNYANNYIFIAFAESPFQTANAK